MRLERCYASAHSDSSKGEELAHVESTYLGEQRRRSARVEQTSPVIIRGVDLLGQPFEERTAAQNLSLNGCRYTSKHHLPKDTWVTLEVPSGESRGEAMCVRARVAWIQRPRTLRDLFQVGVELENDTNVWNVTSNNWNRLSTADAMNAESIPTSSKSQSTIDANPPENQQGTSLEVYLQMALAHTTGDFAGADEYSEVGSAESNPLLAQLRDELLAQSKAIVAEARVAADEAAQIVGGLLRDFESLQEESSAALRKKLMEELEQGKLDLHEQIVLSLNTQLPNLVGQVRSTISNEWAEELHQVQVERSRWESEVQALREAVRTSVDARISENDRRWNEKFMELQREGQTLKSIEVTNSKVVTESIAGVLAEAENARSQWNELLETSLDSAAQRLSERLTGTSQELLHRTEQELAKRAADLQKELGHAAEANRSAFNEVKASLDAEVTRARTSLDQIEQTAGRFSEYSRQLDVASQDSLNELRQRLESDVTQRCADLNKKAVEIERELGARAALMLAQMSREEAARCMDEIGLTVARGLDRLARASEEISAREEQAEGILRVHRERLRQVSEQVQREGSTHLASSLALLQKDVEEVRTQALAQSNQDFMASAARATEEACTALEKKTARQLAKADEQLLVRAQQAVDSARERIHVEIPTVIGTFRDELGEIEANHLVSVQEKLALATENQLDSAKNEFAKAAENAASAFGEVMEETVEGALQEFSTASNARAEQEHVKLTTVGEKLHEELQGHVQDSLEQFQKQLAVQMEQALQSAGESLAHHFEATLEKFRAQGEQQLVVWSTRQSVLSEQSLEKQDLQLRVAADSWIEATIEQLDTRSDERVRLAVRSTENAVREACADIFDNLAQAMKKQLQGTVEIRHSSPPNDEAGTQHRASA